MFEQLSPEIQDKLVPLDLRRNPYAYPGRTSRNRESVAPRRKDHLPGRELYLQQPLLGQSKMNFDSIFNGQHVRLG